jgi:hypothetical protein
MEVDDEILKLLKEYKDNDIERDKKLEEFLETIDSEWEASQELSMQTDCHASHASHSNHSSHGSW